MVAERDPQGRLQRRAAERNVGAPFAMQHKAPMVQEVEKYRNEDEVDTMKIETKSVDEYRDEDEANKMRIEAKSADEYRDEDEANKVTFGTTNGSETSCVTERNIVSEEKLSDKFEVGEPIGQEVFGRERRF